ncbi:hypothetical protein [Peristeroidobacter agariperforans]|uniref:hypothetical protein n=1 Tax=Peristeroidobacter agariperforans TaxID=268404 RepID=UPI001300BA82|nr:hypothetical protein [Peristeroidobacter agariperforans]
MTKSFAWGCSATIGVNCAFGSAAAPAGDCETRIAAASASVEVRNALFFCSPMVTPWCKCFSDIPALVKLTHKSLGVNDSRNISNDRSEMLENIATQQTPFM